MALIFVVLWLFTQAHATTVRLSGGKGPWEGRLEINHNGSWATVCNREFRLNDAKVVCHMLGYQRVIAVFNRKRLSSGNGGHIMLNNIRCTGNEDDIGTCPSSEWFKTNCDYHSDVGLNCVRHGLEPVEGVRLVGGTGPYEGTVELNINGVWGTICSNSFDLRDANVICKMAGYPRAVQAFRGAHFGKANGSVLLDYLHCTGSETNIDNCNSDGWYRTNCYHSQDAGVACLSSKRSHTVEGIRLAGGMGPYEGTVQLNINGVWGSICDNSFDINDAHVICKMAGYPRAVQAFIGAHFGKANGSVMIDYLHCTGNETNIDNCNSDGWYRTNCYHSQDAGVACLGSIRSHIVEGIRLAGGTGPYEGTVELNINGVWGTICGNSFDIDDAHVICRMAGYPRAVKAFRGAHFGVANGSILLDYLHCTGNETNIENCNSDGWYRTNCYHSQDAGVVCLGNGPAIG